MLCFPHVVEIDAPIAMWRDSPGGGWKWREAISKAEASANMIVTLTERIIQYESI